MGTRLQELQALLRKQNPKTAGEDGEKYAEKWLKNSKWVYEPIEQGHTTLSKQLREHGGKRPDFIAESKQGNDILLLDAKHRDTKACSIFWLTDVELQKYHALKSFTEKIHTDGEVWVLFMVFPKEHDGTRFVWVDLGDFENAPVYTGWSEPAKVVSLTERNDLWYENP